MKAILITGVIAFATVALYNYLGKNVSAFSFLKV